MTFDEANKKLDEALDLVDYTFLPEHLDEILKKLRQEYSPIVEMTQKQKGVIMSWKRGSTTFNDFINRHPFGFENLTEEQLMQAWLHPDDIVVVSVPVENSTIMSLGEDFA